MRKDLRELGSVNIDSIEEYKTMKERYDFMCEQRVDLEDTMSKLRKIINDMTATMKEQFKTQFEIINKNFAEVFKELFGGGNASLKLEDEENILECGIEITVQPPGKKLAKYDAFIRWRKSIYSNCIIICYFENKSSTILRIR